MGDKPTSVNVWANFFNTVVGLFLTADLKAVEAYIAVQVPILESPWLSWLTNGILQHIANAIQYQMAMVGDGIVISMQTDGEVNAVQTAYMALQKARASGDVNEIATARRIWISAAAALAHSDGSATNASP